MDKKLSDHHRVGVLKRCSDRPWLPDLIDYSNSVIQLSLYHRYIQMQGKLEEGPDPIPDRDQHKELLLQMGHDKALVLLPHRSILRYFFLKQSISIECYLGFYGVCLARLLVDYPAPFTYETIRRLYGLIDRLLFGGASFALTDEVPTIGDWFWREVASIQYPPALIHTGIITNRHYKIQEELKECQCRVLEATELGAMHLLTATSALRNGRKRATAEDARDAALALTDLFYVDVTKLEPPRRVLATVGTAR